MSEEIVTALLVKPSYDFHELFRAVHETLRARKAANGGEEVLRLRVYEKLQNFVAGGLVKKIQKQYFGVEPALRARDSELAAAKAQSEEWRAKKARLLMDADAVRRDSESGSGALGSN